MQTFSVIGKPVPMIDGVDKVSGTARFAADMKLRGLLVGRILRSPIPHARIVGIDVSRAVRLPGVKAVVTGADTPGARYGIFVEDQLPLAIDRVRFVGDEVAAVAALDEDVAEEALELIRVEYAELPAIFDPEEAMRDGAPRLHDADCNIVHRVVIDRGDVDAALKEADLVVEERFRTQVVHQGYMEPTVCVADWAASGRITMWAPLQAPFVARPLVAKALGVPEHRIRIVQTSVGGAFGGKGTPLPVHLICCLLSRKAGRPVRLALMREEEFQAGRPRVPAVIELTMAARRDGTLVAKDCRITADAGAYAGTGFGYGVLTTMSMRIDSLYRITNVRARGNLVYTNNTPSGAFRGFGNPQKTFAVESVMDMLAERLGMDPLDLRLKNATQAGDVTVHGWVARSCGLSECLTRAAEQIGWRVKRRDKRVRRGVGLACMIHVSGNRFMMDFDGSTALVYVEPNGTARVISGEGDMGQGSRTILAQVAAEELGLQVSDIEVSGVDTETSPYCLGCWGDRTTTIAGNAVRLAAGDARRQLLEVAAERLEVAAGDLIVQGGAIRVRGFPDRSTTVAEAARAALYRSGGQPITGKATFDPATVMPDPATRYGNVSTAYVFAAQAAEVEVDTETGEVKVLEFVSAHDLGRVINPLLAVGQVEGAAAQGIGYALYEELEREAGKVLNPNFARYRMLTALDVPSVKAIFVESQDPTGPYGAKGIAEPGLVPTAPAVANAIYDAVGVRITELPITPRKVLEALERKRRRRL